MRRIDAKVPSPRQVPVGSFTLDFASRRERLAIELDGGREAQDAHRTSYLEKSGWTVMRFTNRDVLQNPEGVAVTILEALTHIVPSPRRGEG